MYDVITIGTATRDVFLKSRVFKPIKDPHFTAQLGFPTGVAECFAFGGKIEIDPPILTTGGGSTNAAATFARQGLNTAAIISISKDEHGKAVLADLKKENVKPVVSYAKDLQTSYSTILLSETGERTILVYRGASDYMGRVGSGHLKAKWAYIVPGAIPLPRMKSLIERFKAKGIKIAMNPSGHYIKLGQKALAPILNDLAVVIINREEAASLAGMSYDDERGIFKKLDELVPGITVMTDGPRGVTVSDGKMIYKAGIFKEQKLVDRTGAGDAFGSGFVAGLIRRSTPSTILPLRKGEEKVGDFSAEGIKYAIRLASANATSVVEYIGAKEGILTRHRFELEQRWENLPIEVQNI
jgi:ribokinase